MLTSRKTDQPVGAVAVVLSMPENVSAWRSLSVHRIFGQGSRRSASGSGTSISESLPNLIIIENMAVTNVEPTGRKTWREPFALVSIDDVAGPKSDLKFQR